MAGSDFAASQRRRWWERSSVAHSVLLRRFHSLAPSSDSITPVGMVSAMLATCRSGVSHVVGLPMIALNLIPVEAIFFIAACISGLLLYQSSRTWRTPRSVSAWCTRSVSWYCPG